MLDEEESSTESEPEEAVPVEVELTWRALVTSCDQLDDPTTCAQQAEVGPCVCVGCRQILSCTRIAYRVWRCPLQRRWQLQQRPAVPHLMMLGQVVGSSGCSKLEDPSTCAQRAEVGPCWLLAVARPRPVHTVSTSRECRCAMHRWWQLKQQASHCSHRRAGFVPRGPPGAHSAP